MNQENRPVADNSLQVQQRQQRLHLQQQEQRQLQQQELQQQQQEQQPSSEQQEQQQEQQPPINKPMEKDLNLREYKNLIPKTIAEIQAIHERGKKLYSKRKHYKREPYPPQTPRELTKEEKQYKKLQREKDIKEYRDSITYSSYYYDDLYEYRHVILPKMIARWLPPVPKLMEREEWLAYGVSQSLGWVHYMVYAPEPHILLFRRDREKYATNKSSKPAESEDANVKNEQEGDNTELQVEQVEKEELVTSEIEPVRPTAYARISRSTRVNAIDTIKK